LNSFTFRSCGYYHTALISEDGRLFMFGNNEEKQLGRSMPSKFAGPLEVSIRNKVKAVACGYLHTVVLTDNGEVFACGMKYSFIRCAVQFSARKNSFDFV
jgi:X-linked retinitis pigmentosa GTPase regulator